MKFSRIRVIAIAVCIVLSTTAAATGIAISGNGGSGVTLVAKFDSAAPLVNGNQVKLDGVVVGDVVSLEVRDGHAEVRLRIEQDAMPLHQDATFTIRPVSLLGERYVDLDRGSEQAPLLDPTQPVPVSQTGTNVNLDELLNTFDGPTSKSLAFLVTTLGESIRGNGGNADAAIRALAPAMRDTKALTKVLAEHNDLLTKLVDRVQPVSEALAAEDGRAMDKLVDSADRLLAAATKQQQALDTTLAELPATLESARKTLGHLTETAKQATPTLQGMRPATENLRAISGELMNFADSLDPALATAKPVLQRAEALLDAAAPVADSLRKAGPGLRESVQAARPIVEDLTANMDNVFNFIRYWALATNGHDGLSHYFRVNLIVHPAAVTGLLPATQPAEPAQPGKPAPPKKPGVPKEGPLPGLPGVPALLDPKPSSAKSPEGQDRGPTGLTPKQEDNLMGFLFGSGS